MTMPIPDEKARAWTRPEDYWPPRRLRRRGRSAVTRFVPPASGDEDTPGTRPLLDIIPYAVVMLGLAVLAAAIIVLAWPGRPAAPPSPSAAPVEAPVGTAPRGWFDDPTPTRS